MKEVVSTKVQREITDIKLSRPYAIWIVSIERNDYGVSDCFKFQHG